MKRILARQNGQDVAGHEQPSALLSAPVSGGMGGGQGRD